MPETLLTSPADILAQYIIAQGIADMTNPSAGNDWPLYTSYMPDGDTIKTDIGVMYDTPGFKDGRLMEGLTIQKYGVQLKTRSQKHIEGWSKAELIAATLDDVDGGAITIDSITYEIQNVSRQGPVIPLGVEKGTTNRRLFAVNFLLTIKRTN